MTIFSYYWNLIVLAHMWLRCWDPSWRRNGLGSNRCLQPTLDFVEGGNLKRKSLFSLGNVTGEESTLTKTSEHFWRLWDLVVMLDFLILLQPSWSNTLLQSAGSLGVCKLLHFVCIPCKDGHIYNWGVNSLYPNWPVTFWCKVILRIGQTNTNAEQAFLAFTQWLVKILIDYFLYVFFFH